MMMLTVVLEDDSKHWTGVPVNGTPVPFSDPRSPPHLTAKNGANFCLNSTRPVHRYRTDDQLEPVDPATSNSLGEARLCPSHVDPGSNFVDAEARAGRESQQ